MNKSTNPFWYASDVSAEAPLATENTPVKSVHVPPDPLLNVYETLDVTAVLIVFSGLASTPFTVNPDPLACVTTPLVSSIVVRMCYRYVCCTLYSCFIVYD